MFKFRREKILPLFLKRKWSVARLAREARTSHNAASRAVNGLSINAPTVSRIAQALNIEPLALLETTCIKR